MLLVLVLLEPVRSAEPPSISGIAGTRLSSANSDAVRDAISFGASASDLFTACTAALSLSAAISPRIRRSNSVRFAASSADNFFFQAACACCERRPALRQLSRISAGISKAASLQPSALRAPAISSAPSGEPCELDLPALLGAPKPIVVLQAISVGLSEDCALPIAAAIASGS